MSLRDFTMAARAVLAATIVGLLGTVSLTRPAFAAGVVGTGTAASCTEAAFDAALVGGDNVTFNCGPGPTTITLTSTKPINGTTSIDAGTGQVALSGGGPTGARMIMFSVGAAGNLTLTNLILRDASYGQQGGAITNAGVLTVSKVSFINNSAYSGSAIFNAGGASKPGIVSISNSSFSGNVARFGGFGGAIGGNDGRLSIVDSTFSNNQAEGGGGAIDYAGGTLTLQRLKFSNNVAESYNGGAIYLTGVGTATIENSTFDGNGATVGAGRAVFTGGDISVRVTGSTFTNNAADLAGAFEGAGPSPLDVLDSTIVANSAHHTGAVARAGGGLVLSNSTIANNTASVDGGAISNLSPSDGAISLFNTIVANNTAAGQRKNCAPSPFLGGSPPLALSSVGYNLDSDGTCQLNGTGDLSNVDPKLGPLQDNGGPTQTMALGFDSPAIDAGAPTTPEPRLGLACLPADQRGIARPIGKACDMGAFELQKATLSIAPAGTGTGSITSSPAGINCSVSAGQLASGTSGCVANFAPGTAVSLTATPGANSTFTSWSGACSGSNTCSLNLATDQTVTATFTTPGVQMLGQPQRLADTRTSGGPIATGTAQCFTVAGVAGVPSDAAAVVLNVTAVGYLQPGWLTVYPAGQAVPPTSTLNFDTSEYAVANGTIARVGSGGQVCVSVGTVNAAPGGAQVVLDVTGFLRAPALAQLPMLASPQRLVDTRAAGGPIATGSSRCFTVAGQGGVPADAAAVVLNVTAVGYGTQGWLTVYPAGQAVPATSTLNFDTTEYAMANGTVMRLGTSGQVCVNVGTVNSTPGSSQVILDVTGSLTSAGLGQLPMLTSPQRVVDTRTSSGPIATGTSRCFQVAGLMGIPATATGILVNVTAVGYGTQGWLSAYPAGQSVPATSTLNFDQTEYAIANGTLIRLGAGGQVCVSVGTVNSLPGSSHVILDVVGYLA